jgi:hypothetical protein
MDRRREPLEINHSLNLRIRLTSIKKYAEEIQCAKQDADSLLCSGDGIDLIRQNVLRARRNNG